MKKRIFALMLAVALVFALAVPALAASGLSDRETALYNKFCSVVDKHTDVIDSGIAAQYKSQAQIALGKIDLSEAACNEFSALIDDVDAYITANIKTKEDAFNKSATVVSMVNAVAKKYNITVSVDNTSKSSKTRGYVTITIKDGKETSTIKFDGSIVKQTGFDTTATFVVVGVLAAALVFGLVIVRKEKLISRG